MVAGTPATADDVASSTLRAHCYIVVAATANGRSGVRALAASRSRELASRAVVSRFALPRNSISAPRSDSPHRSVLESHLGMPQLATYAEQAQGYSTWPTTRFVRLSGTAWPPRSAGYGRCDLLRKTARGL